MSDTPAVKLQKRYYTVEQVAERWQCSIDDINHLIEIGALETAHKGAARFGKKHIRLIPCETEREALQIMSEPSEPEEGILDVPAITKVGGIVYDEEVVLSVEQKRMTAAGHFDIVITADEVRRYEREHGVHGASDEFHQAASLNTPDHPCYSEELAIAASAWTALYSESDGKQINGLQKKHIEKWIRDNYPSLLKETVRRIATVVNPNKKGGAPITP